MGSNPTVCAKSSTLRGASFYFCNKLCKGCKVGSEQPVPGALRPAGLQQSHGLLQGRGRIPPYAPIITTQVLHWVVIFYCRFHLCWGSATGQITNERHHFMQDPSPILRTPPILSSIASLGSVQIIPANCPKSYSRNCTRISGLVWNKFYKSHCNLPMKKAPRHPSSLGGCLFYQVGNTCFTLWILHVSFQLCLCTIYACFYNYKYIQL